MAVIDNVIALGTPGAVMAYARQIVEAQLGSIVNGDLTVDFEFAVNYDYRSLVIKIHFIPGPNETNKALAVAKVAGSSIILIGAGVVVFFNGKRRKQQGSV